MKDIPVVVTTIRNPLNMQKCLGELKVRGFAALVNPNNGTGLYIAANLNDVKGIIDKYSN